MSETVSRREFLKIAGVAGATISVGAGLGGPTFRERPAGWLGWWSWRESNPRPGAANQVFSGRSP